MTEEFLWNGVTMHNPSDVFRLSADSVVLADFAAPERGAALCDLGCGTGALLLMLLANDPALRAVGVELQPEAAALAEENLRRNGFDGCRVIKGDLREIRTLLPANGFRCVVSNPPFFPADSIPPKSEALALARTEKACTSEDLCAAAAWLLTSGGHFCFVHRPERLQELLVCLDRHRFALKRMQFVRHQGHSRRSLVLLDAVLDGGSGLACPDDIILYNADGTPTEDCRRIYHTEGGGAP